MQGQDLLKQSKRNASHLSPASKRAAGIVTPEPQCHCSLAGDMPPAAACSWAGLKGTPRA